MKKIILILFVAMFYLHIVTPEKKLHKKAKIHKRHGALKVVFGG